MNKTGPLASLGRLDQIVWARVPPAVLANNPDPSSGANSAHYELALAVSLSFVSLI